MNYPEEKSIYILAGRKKQGVPTLENQPGSHTGATRRSFETDQARIVYLNQTTGNDGNTGNFGSPKLTWAAAAALVNGTTKFTVEKQDSTDLAVADFNKPTQASIGLNPRAFSEYPGIQLEREVTTPAINSAFTWYANNGGLIHIAPISVAGASPTQYQLSVDGALTWTTKNFPVIAGDLMSSRIFYDSVSQSFFGVVSKTAAALGYIARTTDGTNWSLTPINGFSVGTSQPLMHAFARLTSLIVIPCGTAQIIYSDDGGNTFRCYQATGAPFVGALGGTDAFALPNFFGGPHIFVCNGNGGGGVFRTSNGTTWTTFIADSATQFFWAEMGSNEFLVYTNLVGNTVRAYTSVGTLIGSAALPNATRIRWSGEYYYQQLMNTVTNPGTTVAISNAPYLSGAAITPVGTVQRDVATTAATSRGDYWIYQNMLVSSRGDGAAAVGSLEFGPWRLKITPSASLNSGRLCGFQTPSMTGPCTIATPTATAGAIDGSINCTFNLFAKTGQYVFKIVGSNQLSAINNIFNSYRFKSIEQTTAVTFAGLIQNIFNNTNSTISTSVAYLLSSLLCINNLFTKTADFTNATGVAGEQLFDNIFMTNAQWSNTTPANFPTIRGGDLLGSITNGLINTDVLIAVDPLFDSIYRLQRESGYDGLTQSAFNSRLVAASNYYTNAAGARRDIGPWSFNDSAVTFGFSRALKLPKGKSITSTIRNQVYEITGLSGEVDVYNDADKKTQVIEISWDVGLERNFLESFDYLDSLTDTTCFLSIDPALNITIPSITVNGNQAAGTVVLNINPINYIPSGARMTISGYTYFFVYTLDASNLITPKVVTKIVLSEPLRVAVTNGQVIPLVNPSYLGEFKYVPQRERKAKRQEEHLDLVYTQVVARFIRKP